jgi:hypothetical protein
MSDVIDITFELISLVCLWNSAELEVQVEQLEMSDGSPTLQSISDIHGIYLPTLGTLVQHSCEGNLQVETDSGSALVVRWLARRPIRKDEELTIAIVDPELPYEERRELLMQRNFICHCRRCLKMQ